MRLPAKEYKEINYVCVEKLHVGTSSALMLPSFLISKAQKQLIKRLKLALAKTTMRIAVQEHLLIPNYILKRKCHTRWSKKEDTFSHFLLCLSFFVLFLIVPSEIIARGPEAKRAYENALKNGKVKVYRCRIMLIGQDRAGKTSLKKHLLGLPFDPDEESTDGVEVDPSIFEYDVDQATNWTISSKKPDVSHFVNKLAKIVAAELREQKINANQEGQDLENRVSKMSLQSPRKNYFSLLT